MTTIQININSAAYRSTHRPKKIIWRCDLCGERPAVIHVHRIDGARIVTATVCRECQAKWDGGAR